MPRTFDSTVAAVATPPGMGAVSLIRVSGPGARAIVAGIFRPVGRAGEVPRVQRFGRIVDRQGDALDEVLVTWFRAPSSFTGEDVVEIACHGGMTVTRSILDLLYLHGAEPAEPGEFSRRAFFNGKIDLTQAEAIMDLIAARSELAVKAANQQLAGRLGEEIESLRLDLVGLVAHVEAWIDFPEEDIDPGSVEMLTRRLGEIRTTIGRWLATAERGRMLREGVRTVIAGAPNAGKSSLLNVLLGFDRAIVNEVAGTTRDTVEETVIVAGVPVRLIDTAGIREGGDEVEREGIRRSLRHIEEADLVLHVIDGSDSAGMAGELELPGSLRVIRILNKADRPLHPDWKTSDGLSFSCHDPDAGGRLSRAIEEALGDTGGGFDSANLVAINARHQHRLNRAGEALDRAGQSLAAGESPEFVALDLREALDEIGEVTGKTDVEEILGEIFSTFCIGK